MDLQSFINFRTKCIICQEDMIIRNMSFQNLMFKEIEDGLHIFFMPRNKKGISIKLYNDGTFETNDAKHKIFKSDFEITKTCLAHDNFYNITDILLQNLKDVTYDCQFLLSFDSNKYNIDINELKNV